MSPRDRGGAGPPVGAQGAPYGPTSPATVAPGRAPQIRTPAQLTLEHCFLETPPVHLGSLMMALIFSLSDSYKARLCPWVLEKLVWRGGILSVYTFLLSAREICMR